jgi:hypothetical protein
MLPAHRKWLERYVEAKAERARAALEVTGQILQATNNSRRTPEAPNRDVPPATAGIRSSHVNSV